MKLKLVVSDFHLSAGKWLEDGRRNPLEDFHQDQRFREMLEHHSTDKYASADVELIINGDFFDPLAVMDLMGDLMGEGITIDNVDFPAEVEEGAAVKKFQTILNGHPKSFDGLRDFLKRGKKITIRWGRQQFTSRWSQILLAGTRVSGQLGRRRRRTSRCL